MRFLKNKIARARGAQSQKLTIIQNKPSAFSHLNKSTNASSHSVTQSPSIEIKPKKRNRIPGQSTTPQASRASKNIAKNYGRKICAFATSPIATPYLESFVAKEGVQLDGFTNYVHDIKDNIDGLFHFRSVLLEDENDSPTLKAYKRLFKAISEVFIKYFSVNWIFHSKVFHKEAHLKFRFKMLRRIQSPELFTYMKNANRNRKD